MRITAILSILALAIVSIQTYVFPTIRTCAFEQQTSIGSSLSIATIASSAVSCVSILHILLLLIPLLGGLLLVRKKNFHAFAHYMKTITTNTRKSVIFLAITVGVLTSFYLAPGDFLVSDAGLFQGATQLYKNSFSEGSLPFFSFEWFGGGTPFYAYGPLFFVLAGLIALLGDTNVMVKIVLWLLHIASAISFYLVARYLTKNSAAAIVGALLYALSFQHIGPLVINGRLIESIIFVAAPLLVYFFERIMNERKVGDALLLALTASAVFLASPADAVFVFIAFGAYAGIRFALHPSVQHIQIGVLSGIAFILLCAFWIVPFFLEAEHVNGSARISDEIKASVDSQSFNSFIWPGQWGRFRIYFLSYSALLLSIVAFRSDIKKNIGILAGLGSSFFIAFFMSGRVGSSLLLYAALGASMGAAYLLQQERIRSIRIKSHLLVILLLIVVAIDVGPAAVQPIFADFSHEKSVIGSGGEGRFVDLHTNHRTYYPYVSYLHTDQDVLFGTLLEGAPRSFSHAAAITNRAADEWYSSNQELSETTKNGLYLFNVGTLVRRNEQIGTDPVETLFSKRYSFGLERELELTSIEHSPIVVSTQTQQVETVAFEETENFFTKILFTTRTLDYSHTSMLIERMNVNREENSAGIIFVKNQESRGNEGENSVVVTSLDEQSNTITMTVDVAADGYAQLSYSYLPWITVRVDDTHVAHYQSGLNLIVIPIEAGSHEITIEGTLGNSHLISGWISLLAFGAISAVLLFRRAALFSK